MKSIFNYERPPITRSIMRVNSEYGSFQIIFTGMGNPRLRRAYILSIFRACKKLIRTARDLNFRSGDYKSWYYRPLLQGDWEKRACHVDSKAGELGFSIRIRRHSLGLTQEALARAARINRGHLSEVERGMHIVSPEFLHAVLNSLHEFETDKNRQMQIQAGKVVKPAPKPAPKPGGQASRSTEIPTESNI